MINIVAWGVGFFHRLGLGRSWLGFRIRRGCGRRIEGLLKVSLSVLKRLGEHFLDILIGAEGFSDNLLKVSLSVLKRLGQRFLETLIGAERLSDSLLNLSLNILKRLGQRFLETLTRLKLSNAVQLSLPLRGETLRQSTHVSQGLAD